jgi:uncharacterized membrane protein
MNYYQIFYLFSIADRLSQVLLTLSWITGVVALVISVIIFINMISSGEAYDDEGVTMKYASRFGYIFYPVFFIVLLSYILVPSKKDMLLILAGGGTMEYLKSNDDAKKLPDDILRFVRGEILTATSSLNMSEQLGIETEKDRLKKLSKDELIEMLGESKNDTQTKSDNDN